MSFARPAKRGCQGRPPLTGVQGCPLIFPLSSRAAAGGEQKESKEVFGDTPNPGKGLPPSALPFLGRTFKNFAPGMVNKTPWLPIQAHKNLFLCYAKSNYNLV